MVAGGSMVGAPQGNYEGRVTPFVVVTCLVAATGGLIFGYDIGISGSYFIYNKKIALLKVCQ